MNRDHRAPAGPRRENQSPTRRPLNLNPPSPTKIGSIRRPTVDAPMLSASSSNNHSLFSFGAGNGVSNNVTNIANASFEFLPSVSFDDLQSSLESASTDFKLTQFPSPTGQGTILGDRSAGNNHNMVERPDMTRPSAAAHALPQQPAITRSRTGSILRRPSTSSRPPQPSTASTPSGNPGVPNAPTAPAAMRARRQSHYPPVSNPNPAKPPRKSTGDVQLGEAQVKEVQTRKRRPSAVSLSDRPVLEASRASVDVAPRSTVVESMRHLTSSRASKARSVQPLPRSNQDMLTPDTTLKPEHTHIAMAMPRSPNRVAAKGSTPSSAKRISVMPGTHHASHATGLGARTISPTDTRRMKRLSTMHHVQQGPVAGASPALPHPPPISADGRASSRSPSMLPRKISTPSSSRTTPDHTRKSYSSGLSVNSSTSLNTVRTSTGSMQQRAMQGANSSRLPAPKALNLHNSASFDSSEEVPPVPAIPKAYESPKEAHLEAASFLEKRRSNLAYDASSIHSNSTASISGAQTSDSAPAKLQRKPSNRKTVHTSKLDFEKNPAAAQSKKSLQPLRLPPITLGPLSTPTAAKIAALQTHGDRNLSPPPSRQIPKTPTTPMTASKGTFFGRIRPEDRADIQHLRSSASVQRLHRESPATTAEPPTSSTESFAGVKNGTARSGPSPFLSQSVPKGGNFETTLFKRSKTGGDFTQPLDAAADMPVQHNKPSGPRAQKSVATRPAGGKSPPPRPSPEEPPTPSSMSSLRRKLSLSWKRSASKASGSQGHHGEQNAVKHDSMPPPRIPVSATLNNLPSGKPPSPTPSTKSNGNGTYLESRRRKSSASSLNAVLSGERNRGDTGTAAKKDSTLGTVNERATVPHNSSVVQRILKPKGSTATLRHHDVWNSELDKDDLIAEDEMRKLGSRRKDTELAARTLDALRKRASAKERVSPQEAIRIAVLNIYERGEIVDYKDIYFCGTQNAAKVVGDVQSESPNFGYDDERGDYSIVPGDHLAYRYEIIDVLGKGSFGQVVRCIDHKTGVLVAVKIIRNKKRFHQQALVEVNILQKLREWDPKNKHSMVNFTHSFYFRGHLCISTELLDMNLYEFIKSNAFRGFSLKLIRRFTKQMLSSLNLLKQHKVIHCDLKPENILLRHPLHSEIKVIDFGSSCFETEKVYTYIQSRFYRSPEVILGMQYGLPIDMWSLGCILAELYTGVPIFPGENEQEQLACIMEVFGPPEKHLIEKSTRKKLFFDSMGKPRLTVSSKGRRRRPSSKTLQQVLKCDDEAFLDFIARCLRWDPDRRMKPEEAIRHEFITGQKTSVPIRMREGSPSKRTNSVSAPRPLPEPPAVVRAATMRAREASGPNNGSVGTKTGSMPTATARRTSNMSTASSMNGSISSVKRTSNGTTTTYTNGNGTIGPSSLPRASLRSVSGGVGPVSLSNNSKTDLAAAGANAAMSRRA
ncbi:serine/threonine protein kinase, CMGC, dual-specificity [Podospora pseudopauciseta]|uniref:dual-specificity kinase n=1 Tax=Podospora pseudopauciseta TaxID=2093780 RepID=A0ABR0HMJ6_9PEZI|nr:serine/threonine protein kinase, CMGC, dual-specificity [Podospora pseudopauciseta]